MADRSWSPEEIMATPSKGGFPRVDKPAQRARDEDRLSILYREREDQLRNGRVDPALDREISLQERKSGTSVPKLTPTAFDQPATTTPSKGPVDSGRRSWSPEELTGVAASEPKLEKSTSGGFLEAFGRAAKPELPGWAQGLADFIGSAPGAIGGTALALGDMARGTKPSVALQGVMGAMEELNPFNLIPGKEGRRQGAAYETSPGTILGHTAGKAMEGYGKMAGWASTLTGLGTPEELDAGAQIGLLATLPFLRGQGPAPTSPAGYRQVAQSKPTPQQIAQSRAAQASYLPDRLRAFQEQNPTVEPAKPRAPAAVREDMLDLPDVVNQRVRPADELTRPDEMLGRPTSDTTLLPRSVKAQEDVMSQRVEGLQEPWAPMEEIMKQDPEWQQHILRDQLGNDMPAIPRQGGSIDFKTGTSLEDAIRSRQQAHDAKVQDLITRADQQRESLPFRGPGSRQRGAFDPEMLVALKRKLETSLRNVQAEYILGKIPKSFIEKREIEIQAQLLDVKRQLNEGMNSPRDPFSGPGKSQVGAVDPKIFRDILEKIKAGASVLKETLPKKGDVLTYHPDLLSTNVDSAKHTGRIKVNSIIERPSGWYVRGQQEFTNDYSKKMQGEKWDSEDAFPLENLVDFSGHPLKDPFKGPGRSQAGAINISRDDLARLFRTDPARAAIELAKNSTFDQFERELVNQLGEEARSYAQQVYQQAKGQSTALTTTQQTPQGTSRSYVPVTTSRTGSSLAGRTLNDFNTWDRRDGATALRDFQEGWKNGSLKDLKRDALMKQGQSRGRQHPIMKWVWDRADWAERETNMAVAELLYGWDFAQKSWLPILRSTAFRKAKRIGDPDSMMYEWGRIKEAGKEQLIDVFQKFNGEKNPTKAELAAEGLNPSQIRSYEAVRRGLERAWDEYLVPAAAKVGIELPAKLPGYVPMMWFGDFRVWGKNRETGAYDFVYGVSSAWQASRAIKEMNERFGDKWEFSPQDVTTTHSEFHSVADAFVDAIRLMGNNSAEGKLLLSAMNEIMARQGASRHRLSRNEQGTTGYAGQLEQGRSYDPRNLFRKNRIINFERSLESYIKGLVRYAKNKELLFDLEKVLKNPEMQENFHRATQASENILDSFFGRDKFYDTAIKEFMLEKGLPSRLPENFISGAASWLMYTSVMAWRLPFYFAQSVQDVFIVPRMLMQKSMGTEASINKAVFQGFFDWLGLADAKDVQWLIKYGIVEPKFSENVLLMPSLRGNPLKFNYHDIVNLVSGNTLAATIDSSVRLRSALILKRFFENSGMDPKSAMEAAAKNSLDVMVEYEGWKRARMYTGLGMVGNVASPLTTFLNNIWNRFGDAMGQMVKGNEHKITDMTQGKDGVYTTKKKRSPLPFLALYGVFATLAGLSGLPGRGEWNAVADFVNGVTGSTIPTADDQLIKLSKVLREKGELQHDAAIFGPPSGLLGYNFSGTLGAPETVGALLPFMGDPLPRKIGQGLYYSGKVAAQALTGGVPRDSDVYNALKQILPTAPGHSALENEYSPSTTDSDRPGWMPQEDETIVPDKRLNARFRRTPNEQFARIFGLKSNQEALYDLERYRANRDKISMQTRRSDAIAVAADRIIDPRDFDKASEIIERQMNKYVENGGDPKKWQNTVIKELYERTNTETERELRAALKAKKDPRPLMLLEKHGLIQGERSGFQKQNFDPFKDFEKQWGDIQKRMEGSGPADEVIREYPNPDNARIKDFGKRRRTIEEEEKYPIPLKYKRKRGTSI